MCGNLMPSAARDSFFVMRAFNAELAVVRDQARGNAAMAAVRFQFWRSVVDAAYKGEEHSHPLAAPLGIVARRHDHTRRWLDRIIEAREDDAEGVAPRTMADLEQYGEMTQSSLLYLALESLGVRDVGADHAASHVGKAFAIATILRGLPFHGAAKQRYIPDDVMQKHGLSEAALFKVGDPESPTRDDVAAAVFDVACVAHEHLHHARELASDVPEAGVPALLIAECASAFLELLEAAQFDVCDPSLWPASHLSLQWRLVKATLRHTY